MEYRVIRYFTDLQDGNHPYHTGDTYPREGLEPAEDRIAELASDRNLQRTPLIVLVNSSAEDTGKPVDSVEEPPAQEDPTEEQPAEEKKPRARKRKKADT